MSFCYRRDHDKLKEIPEIVDIYIVKGTVWHNSTVKLNTEAELKELVSERYQESW